MGNSGADRATTDGLLPSSVVASRESPPWSTGRVVWAVSGVALFACHLGLAQLSPRFAYGVEIQERPAHLAAVILIGAGVVFLVAARTIPRVPSRRLLWWVFGAGVAMRAIMLSSTPILEDDFYRYLWDGGLLAHGISPYAHTPADAATSSSGKLHKLAADSGHVLSRVNHAEIRTIYPMVAQAAFVLAHWLDPWDLTAWRIVLMGSDLVTFVLLLVILRSLRLPALWVSLYWWNPIVVKEGFNSAHMDLVVAPFVLAALIAAMRRRPTWAAFWLALATATKVWPVILLPVVLRPLLARPARLVACLFLFAAITVALFAPVLIAGLESGSGFREYGRRWEMNDALFMLVLWPCEAVAEWCKTDASLAPLAARGIVCALLAAWTLVLVWHRNDEPRETVRRSMWIVAALFLLSPTQFPWYYVWLLPLLVFEPRASLLSMTALLPLYYLRFYMAPRGHKAIFDNGIVFIEHAPVWCLLAWEWWRHRRRG